MITQKVINGLTYKILGYAIEVHKGLGPGLLERVYEKCMAHLLTENGFKVSRQQIVPIEFKDLQLDCDLRLDILVNDLIIVELKTVEFILIVPIFLRKGKKLLLLNISRIYLKDTNVAYCG